MKILVAIAMPFITTIAFSDPVIFGLELGRTTEKELKAEYAVTHTGINSYSDGNMYRVPTSEINFKNLQKVITIFNSDGILTAVLITLPKSRFNSVNQSLSSKYELKNQDIPFVGNKSVTYQDGGTTIMLEAPHMSFELTLNYIRDDLLVTFGEQRDSEHRKKRAQQDAQL